MTSLPRKGDRVRVTAITPSSALQLGAYATLANNAHVYEDDWIHFDFDTLRVSGSTWSGPVKVEILERATPADLFADFTSDEDQSESDYTRGRRDGMRRTLELIEQHLCYCQGWAEFDEAVAKELAND